MHQNRNIYNHSCVGDGATEAPKTQGFSGSMSTDSRSTYGLQCQAEGMKQIVEFTHQNPSHYLDTHTHREMHPVSHIHTHTHIHNQVCILLKWQSNASNGLQAKQREWRADQLNGSTCRQSCLPSICKKLQTERSKVDLLGKQQNQEIWGDTRGKEVQTGRHIIKGLLPRITKTGDRKEQCSQRPGTQLHSASPKS